MRKTEKFFLFIRELKHIKMEHSHLPKHIVFTVIEGQLYMEHSEVLTYLDLPRTTFNRMVEKLALLEEGDTTLYKNRKLLRAGWVYDFWKKVSERKWGR